MQSVVRGAAHLNGAWVLHAAHPVLWHKGSHSKGCQGCWLVELDASSVPGASLCVRPVRAPLSISVKILRCIEAMRDLFSPLRYHTVQADISLSKLNRQDSTGGMC